MLPLSAVLDFLEKLAPLRLAAEWDNVGLLLGDQSTEILRVMTCLTVTPESAAEAVEQGTQLIVTHHPILFRPVQRLTNDTPEGRTISTLMRAGVAVYSPHTAFDNAKGGINDLLAKRLGLVDVTVLRRQEEAHKYKLVVFVPEADLGRVSDALFASGAGYIGQYSQCSFRVAGTGTFFGSDATNPTVGQKGRREDIAEWRLEVICPEANVDAAVAAMRKAHSYEEAAFDVYPLRPRANSLGEGRLGRLLQSSSLQEFAAFVKSTLHASLVQTVGDSNRRVERVAIVCGAGGEFVDEAVHAKADVFLTGEVRFHDCLTANAKGLALVLPGHYATERCGIEMLAEQMQAQWPALHIWASHRERDPLAG
jgi:dinuclear metal center YbgI/SA1388 family protein